MPAPMPFGEWWRRTLAWGLTPYVREYLSEQSEPPAPTRPLTFSFSPAIRLGTTNRSRPMNLTGTASLPADPPPGVAEFELTVTPTDGSAPIVVSSAGRVASFAIQSGPFSYTYRFVSEAGVFDKPSPSFVFVAPDLTPPGVPTGPLTFSFAPAPAPAPAP